MSSQTCLGVYRHYCNKLRLHSTVALTRSSSKLQSRWAANCIKKRTNRSNKSKCHRKRYQKHHDHNTENEQRLQIASYLNQEATEHFISPIKTNYAINTLPNDGHKTYKVLTENREATCQERYINPERANIQIERTCSVPYQIEEIVESCRAPVNGIQQGITKQTGITND